MEKSLKTILFSTIIIYSSLISSSYAQTCLSYTFTKPNTAFTRCIDLPVLNSFLHWTHHPSNGTVDVAYRHSGVDPSRWVAWALNVDGSGMIGAQCLVAHRNSSGAIHVYTSPAAGGYGTGLEPGDLSFRVEGIGAETENDEIVIYGSLELPNNRTVFNQVWQEGPLSGDFPARHSTTGDNMRSSGNIDFALEQGSTGGGGGGGGGGIPRQGRRNVHGVLNAISWGILIPLGALIARYLKVFKAADPAWFYLHVACQISAYAIGVAGWATGLKLGSDSAGIKHATHGNIGVALFCLATLQAFAILLRPKKEHKYRVYWNVYHHMVGYTVIILGIINIFRGFDILEPQRKWKQIYIAILIFLGFNALLLESFTWYVLLKSKTSDPNKHPRLARDGASVQHAAV